MTVSAHTLVKNEAKWLWYSVNSVIDFIDKLLLWDTGSTDDSCLIENYLKKKYPDKIIFKKRVQNSAEDFTIVRQEMLDETRSDWFLMLDGDEIWWKESIEKVAGFIKGNPSKEIESIVVPTVNLVGDIYHHQTKDSGRYKFGSKVGHYNLRAIRRSIPGLHSQGIHGVWGWADENNNMIQDRNSYEFINAPYLHATNLRRSSKDDEVIKRSGKLKFELGREFQRDFYYPEALFTDKPPFLESPWKAEGNMYKFRAFFETPFRKLKRKLWSGRVGY